jgi:hypothetical protein
MTKKHTHDIKQFTLFHTQERIFLCVTKIPVIGKDGVLLWNDDCDYGSAHRQAVFEKREKLKAKLAILAAIETKS